MHELPEQLRGQMLTGQLESQNLLVPEPVDLVLLFQRSENVPPFVDEAIGIGARGVWMQSGITNQQAAAKARAAGLDVVQDRCMMVEHRTWA